MRPVTARGIPPGKILSAYRLHKSSRRVAQLLGISATVVIRYIRQLDPSLIMPVGGAYGLGKNVSHPYHGSFAKWVRDHPGTKFPRSLEEIVQMTQCSRDSIKCFLYRQRKAGKPIPTLKRGRPKKVKAK